MAEQDNLPPLPEPLVAVRGYYTTATAGGDGAAFTADQMRDYARAAVAAAFSAPAQPSAPIRHPDGTIEYKGRREPLIKHYPVSAPIQVEAQAAAQVASESDRWRLVRLDQAAYETKRGGIYGGIANVAKGDRPLFAILDERQIRSRHRLPAPAALVREPLSNKAIKRCSDAAFVVVQGMPDKLVNGSTWDRIFADRIQRACAEAWGITLTSAAPKEGE